MWPRIVQVIDDVENLCSREDLGETVGALDRPFATAAVFCCFSSPRVPASRILPPIPSVLAVLPGDGERIAGHHLDLDAHMLRGRDRGLGIVPRRIEQGQHAKQPPFAVALGPRTPPPNETKARAPANSLTALSTAGVTSARIGRITPGSPAARPWSP